MTGVADIRPKKTCTGCRRPKALRAFYCHQSGKDGRASKCKLCTRAMVYANRELKADVYRAKARQRYATDPALRARKQAYLRTYAKTPRGRESRRITQRIYRAHRRAQGLPIFPSNKPAAVAARRDRSAQRQHQASIECGASA